jgi:hypothetical protein
VVVHALKEHDLVARKNFCNLFLWSVHNGEFDPQLVFFYNETWFSLRGEVNCQNSQYWSAENPRLIHELLFMTSARRIIGPIFYDDTVSGARYVINVLSQFFAELTEEERLYSVFQQDYAAAHTAHASLEALWEVFGDHIISCGLLPPCSSNLTSFVTFICGKV